MELRQTAAAAAIFFDQLGVRKCSLWIFIEVFQVRMRGRRIQIEKVFLDVFAMIAFTSRQSKCALLENRIVAIPKRQRKANHLMAIANSGEPVFVPAKSARACMVVGKIIPGIAVGTIVFAHRAPGTLAQIRTPTLPMFLELPRLFEPPCFRR